MAAQLKAIPNPYELDWQSWVDTVVGFNPSLRARISPDLDWQEFGRRLIEFQSQAPDPFDFESWQDWAAALKLCLAS